MEKLMTKNTSNSILQSEVDKLFPFSFSLSNEMRIIRIGPSLSKIIPAENKNKQHFTEIFEISKPRLQGEIDFSSLEKLAGNLIIIHIKNLEKVALKGQLEFRKEQNELIFFGTLWIDHYSKMMEIGLTYTDFPAYDPIFDIQQMKAVLENEKEDIHKLKSELNIINHSADLFLTLLPSGVIKKVSLSSMSMLGYETHELIGENIQSIFFDEKIELKKLFVEIIEKEKPTEFSTHLYTKKHKKVGVGISFTPVKQEITNSSYIVCVIRDITEYLKAHEEISNLASFPNENPNPIFRIDNAGNILFCNKIATNIKEIQFEETTYPIDKFWKYLINFKSHNSLKKIDTVVNKRHITFNIISRESVNEMNVYGTDITERVDSEEKSYESFTRLNSFLESTNDVYYLIYQQNKERNFFTSRWPLFFGFNAENADIWKEKRDSVDVEFISNYDDAFRELKLTGTMSVKYKLKNKISGYTRWVLEEAKIKFDSVLSDEIISGRLTDITSSENYRNQIQESESRFQLITESMPVMIWVSNEKNYVTYTNQTSKDFYGFDLKNIRSGDEFSKFIHPDHHQIAVVDWAVHIKSKRKCEVKYLAKNSHGEYRWIYEIAIPRFLNKNEFLGYIGCGFDITSERNMFYSLEDEKRKYELISNQSADIIFLVTDEGIVEYVSPSIRRVLGFEESDLIGKSLFDLLDINTRISIKDFSQNNLKSGKNVLSFQIKDIKGELKWVEASYNVFKEMELAKAKIIIHLRDINEQYIVQSMLIENEAKYRNLFSNMNLGIMEVDINEKILYVNPAFERISGYDESDLLGNFAPDIFLQEISEKEINIHERRNRQHGKEGLYEIKVKRKDQKDATWVISGAPTFDMKGKVRGSIGIHWDVTEIRDLETKILYESVQREKELMEARLQAEEEQREVIGRDLHDGVGQMLAYLSVYMNILKEKNDVVYSDIDKAQVTIKKTIDEVRRLSRNLAPPAIKDLGFRDAVVELIGSYSIIPKPAFNLKIYKGKDPDEFSYEQKIMLFRIIQELSSNTFKYAKANKVEIKIEFDKKEMRLRYKDDGTGFEFSTVKKGIGLKSILARVEFYKGNLNINTNPGEGTEVIINLPFE
jgi:PAS domain S-box-containing protein